MNSTSLEPKRCFCSHSPSGVLQNFTYDNAHRLETITGYQPLTLTYDSNGNILTKSNLQNGATYQYNNTSTGVAGSHAVTQINNLSYQYAAAGNQTKAFNNGTVTRQVDYNHTHKPTLIDNKAGTTTRFERIDVENEQI